jgi:isoquinoline 1-oxidoreductase beta subunit
MIESSRVLHAAFKRSCFHSLMDGLTLNVNGVQHTVAAADEMRPLLWYLRDRLGLNGTKFGCGHGGCGACTVTVDGRAVQSCMITAGEAHGTAVVTIEGLAQQPDHPIFRAWLADQVPQCGYCQPGMIMTTAALLAEHPDPTDADIDAALDHVLCRCGSYQRVRTAVHRAAESNWDAAPFPASPLPPVPPEPQGARVRFNPWVTIAGDGTVTVTIDRSEMGQGINTSLAMLVAEELDVPPERIRTQVAAVDRVYDSPAIGIQITVGSLSIQEEWVRMRSAGADVRIRLIAAAAQRWNVRSADCFTRAGTVVCESANLTAGYGDLAVAAAALPPVPAPPLKAFDDMRVLGKPTARLEIPGHIAGRSVFGMDVALPGMLNATILFPPAFGAKPVRIESTAAMAIAGVRDVFPIDSGIAVVADDLWTAFRGRDALDVTWKHAPHESSSAQIHAELQSALKLPGKVIYESGDSDAVFSGGVSVLEAEYETPYVAHAPIEPINCTVSVSATAADVWIPTQSQTLAREAAARAAGLPVEAVRIHTTFLGGGFGRRSVPDVVTQAVQIAKRTGTPIQLVWTRADDLANDRFRPAGLMLLRARLDGAHNPVGLFGRIAGPKLASEGLYVAYDIPNVWIESVEDDPGIPTGYWRSVGSSQNAFAIEGFIDELAQAAGADPVDFRLKFLEKSPRHHAVLARAAQAAGWGTPLAGRSRGAAVYSAHGGWAAQIAEVSVAPDGHVAVHRVVCAVDCGFAVNPDTVAAQIEGAIAFGLTAALKSSITINGGHVEQTGFRDFPAAHDGRDADGRGARHAEP